MKDNQQLVIGGQSKYIAGGEVDHLFLEGGDSMVQAAKDKTWIIDDVTLEPNARLALSTTGGTINILHLLDKSGGQGIEATVDGGKIRILNHEYALLI